uniref:Uncharacterized protein n=1 Tax=Panagrellus redivivus TaxID=6233 RepID=A0A7E4UM59_PANRE
MAPPITTGPRKSVREPCGVDDGDYWRNHDCESTDEKERPLKAESWSTLLLVAVIDGDCPHPPPVAASP